MVGVRVGSALTCGAHLPLAASSADVVRSAEYFDCHLAAESPTT